jgi:hypothetical protein
MKAWIKMIVYAVVAVALATTTTVSAIQGRHLRDVRKQVAEQSVIIDSLLTIKRTVFEINMAVTDKSVFKVNGSHNKGEIHVPSDRTYHLIIDSCNVKIKE